MWNSIKNFGKVEVDDVCLVLDVHGGCSVADCLHELGLRGEPCFCRRSTLVMKDTVVSIDVYPPVAKNDMYHQSIKQSINFNQFHLIILKKDMHCTTMITLHNIHFKEIDL